MKRRAACKAWRVPIRILYAGVAQRQSTGFPSRERGFDTRRPIQIQNEKRKMNMANILWIALSGIQLIALVGLVACLPGLYRREAAKERRA